MTKLTLYLEEETAAVLKQLATTEGVSEAELVRDALALYRDSRTRPLPKGTGAYRSGRSDISSRAEEILREAARDRP
jgi:Ribbon-helix-helix protein, copG family